MVAEAAAAAAATTKATTAAAESPKGSVASLTTLGSECQQPASPTLFWRRVSELIRFTLARQHRRVNNNSNSNNISTTMTSSRLIAPPESSEASTTLKMYCRLCLSERTLSDLVSLDSSCGHKFCIDCLREMITLAINESRVMIECPLMECNKHIHPNDITRIVGHDNPVLLKYEQFMVRRVLRSIADVRWCPAPDCTYAVIAHGCASCPRLTCERCKTEFCYHCQQIWHPNKTCADAAATTAATASMHFAGPSSSGKRGHRRRSKRRGRRSERWASREKVDFESPYQKRIILGETIKRCPCCKVAVMKVDDGSCNHITCSQCGAEFCWLCLKVITDLHFLSPSGCTFWGRKRWSRKKKALWQCLALIGAPLGIAIAACISVPAIFVGLPVWAGRKAYKRLSMHSKRKRNIAVCLTSISALLAAPVVASITVVVGVPILLTYTYGVIPMSMCRSSDGCGVDFGGTNDDLLVEESSSGGSHGSPPSEGVRKATPNGATSRDHVSRRRNMKKADSFIDRTSLLSCDEACGTASEIPLPFERSASEATFKRRAVADLSFKSRPHSTTLKSGYASLVGLLDTDFVNE